MARALRRRAVRLKADLSWRRWPAVWLALLATASACAAPEGLPEGQLSFVPTEVIDLGALVTEDLPERVWGKAHLNERGYTEPGYTAPNSFNVIPWTFETEGGDISGSNAYYTLFNHGGPHIDGPNHYGFNGGVDSFPVEAFSGPVRVFDARGYPDGASVPTELFRGRVNADDIVLIVTGYSPPSPEQLLPEFQTLTDEAAEFLASLPVRAYGTDGFSVGHLGETSTSGGHYSFLSRGIPVYEQLFNVEVLLDKQNMFFVGVPLNIKDGDGMIVRPVVFVY